MTLSIIWPYLLLFLQLPHSSAYPRGPGIPIHLPFPRHSRCFFMPVCLRSFHFICLECLHWSYWPTMPSFNIQPRCPQHPSPWDSHPSCLLSTHGTALPLFICYPHFLGDHKFPGGCSTFVFPLVFLAPNARALDILTWSRFGMGRAGYVDRSPQGGIYSGEFIVTQGLALSLKAWELGLTYDE